VPENVEPGSDPPAISVVVPTRDRVERLAALLDSLRSQTLDPEAFEVIVVDDGSADETPALLRRTAADGGLDLGVISGRTAGPAAARNDGWARARGRIVAFTDDDCEASPGWLEAGLRAVDGTQSPWIAQGRTLPNPRESRAVPGLARTKRIESLGPWFQTCNMFYPRELLEALGGFDERFRRPFGEDADLAWRAIEAGAEPRFAPEALVHHAVEPQTAGQFLRSGLRDPDEALAFRSHPGLREAAGRARVFKAESHALLALALAGLLLSRLARPALLLTLPYLRLVAARSVRSGTGPGSAPLIAGYDVLEMWSAVRGSARHRVWAL